MNTLHRFGALSVIALLTSAPTFAGPETGTVVSRDVRVLPPETSRSLKIARTPLPPAVPIIVGTYWSCTMNSGFETCRIKLVVCTDDQSQCVEV